MSGCVLAARLLAADRGYIMVRCKMQKKNLFKAVEAYQYNLKETIHIYILIKQ